MRINGPALAGLLVLTGFPAYLFALGWFIVPDIAPSFTQVFPSDFLNVMLFLFVIPTLWIIVLPIALLHCEPGNATQAPATEPQRRQPAPSRDRQGRGNPEPYLIRASYQNAKPAGWPAAARPRQTHDRQYKPIPGPSV